MNRVILYVHNVTRLKELYQTHFGFRVTEEIAGEWMVPGPAPTTSDAGGHVLPGVIPTAMSATGDSSMKLAEAEDILGLFAQIKTRFETRQRSNLVCKLGRYKNCCVLKLQKPSWTNDPMHWIQNQSGIFFSVWTDRTSQKNDRVFYNIHALKLRVLKGHSITSRDFARDFRNRFEAMRDQWPNVRMDFGPATLMQGWITKEQDVLGKNILVLMERFERLSPIIDDLLKSGRR